MLPTTRRKALEIPHGLAALAAAVCLVLAFAADHRSSDERNMASQSSPAVTEPAQQDKDEASNTTGLAVHETRRQAGASLSLLPWLLRHGGNG